MKTLFNLLGRSVMLLLILVLLVMPGTYSKGSDLRSAQWSADDHAYVTDGTQLVNETKVVVANYLHVSPSQVSASFCCQLTDGRFQYDASVGLQSGHVYWTIENGQIIIADVEGF